MNIEFYHRLSAELQKTGTKLIAVSKTRTADEVMEAYNAGIRRFGENKVQELTDKYMDLPKDIEWHLIGHLQTNKVKYIAGFVAMIHSVDSLKLLEEIDKYAEKNDRVIHCLLQCHIASEETKFGLVRDELFELLASSSFSELKHIQICGLMGMASNTDDERLISKEFYGLKDLFNNVKKMYFPDQDSFKELSMGMSSDYKIAIGYGSTMVRIGSSLFGERS